jgi:hypothetical protein
LQKSLQIKFCENRFSQQKTRFLQKFEREIHENRENHENRKNRKNRENREKLFLRFSRFSQTRYFSNFSKIYQRTTIKFKGLFQGDQIGQIFAYWVIVYLGK